MANRRGRNSSVGFVKVGTAHLYGIAPTPDSFT